jgi:hypothetical protein
MFVPVFETGLTIFAQQAEQIRRLEADLDAALTLLRVLSERVRHALGPEAIGPELSRFLEALEYSEQRDLIGRLDALTAKGAEPEAVRMIRDLTGVTWDEAFAICSAWHQHSAEEKERWARSVQLRKALRPEDRGASA